MKESHTLSAPTFSVSAVHSSVTKSGVVRDDKFRERFNFIFGVPLFHVGDQSLGRTIYVREIHHVRTNAWELRAFVGCRVAAFCFGYDFPNRSPAQSACSKFERFVKAIVELVPFTGSNELVDYARIKFRSCTGEQLSNVSRG